MRLIVFLTVTFLLIFTSNAQDLVDIRTTKLGKQTLYSNLENKLLTGTFKVATSYNGKYAEITLLEGKLAGVRKDYNQNGELVKEENYKDGFLEGKVTHYFRNGVVKREEFYVKSIIDGTCTSYNFKGEEIAKEHYKKGVKVGKWIAKHKKFGGTEYHVHTKQYDEQGKPKGIWKEVDENGDPVWIKKYKTPNHYEKQEYFSNGKKKKEFSRKNNKLIGVYEEYYDTGILKNKQVYKDGKSTFKQNNYDDGTTKFIGNYKNRKSHGEHVHYDNDGVITMKGSYDNSKRIGEWIIVSRGIKTIVNYKKGKKNGKEKVYNSKGKLFSTGNYLNNRKDGLWRFYNAEKEVTKEMKYEEGKRISVTSY